MVSQEKNMDAILSRLQLLEENNTKLSETANKAEQENSALRSALEKEKLSNETFKEEKRKEMMGLWTGLEQWLSTLPINDTVQMQKMKDGLYSLAQKGEKHPIYEMMCHASDQHTTNVNQLEKIRKEHEELKAKMKGGGGQFGDENTRMQNTSLKRTSDEMMSTDSVSNVNDIWSDFTQILSNENKHF